MFETLTERWHLALSLVALLNAAVWLRLAASSLAPPRVAAASVWDSVWRQRLWLSGIYVVACGVRSVWPRHDGDRVCLYDAGLITSVLVGRSLACIAELAFAALICAALVHMVRHEAVRTAATAMFVANVVAQTCCNYAVLTRDQRGHVVEESIWLVSGAIVTVVAWLSLAAPAAMRAISWPKARTFLLGIAVCGPFFVAFMALVDVPMYYHRAVADAAAGTRFSGIVEGLSEITACRRVVTSDDYWRPEMPWMSGYFSGAVWLTLWLTALPEAGEAAAVAKSGKAS